MIDHHVFQTDAAPIGQVEARFNSDDHAGLQLFAAARRKARLLMDRNPHPMAEAMAESIAVTGIDRSGAGAWPHRH